MTKSKREKVQRLLKLFDGGHQIYIDGVKAGKVQVSAATGKAENQVVYLEWRESNEIFNVIITEAGLADAELRETVMELEDHEGEPVTLEFHRPSGIVPIATLFRDQPPMTDPLPEATLPNREDLETSSRSILLQAEQARKILRVEGRRSNPERSPASPRAQLDETPDCRRRGPRRRSRRASAPRIEPA